MNGGFELGDRGDGGVTSLLWLLGHAPAAPSSCALWNVGLPGRRADRRQPIRQSLCGRGDSGSKGETMKQAAWMTIALATLAQLFFDLAPFFLPSMASAEGVAVYPPASTVIIGLSYRCLPYLVFGVSLFLSAKYSAKFLRALAVATIVAVLSPIAAMALATALRVPAREFREEFWPVRPVAQMIVFSVVLLGFQLFKTRRRMGAA